MQSIKFGIMAVVNGELGHFHFTVNTAHTHAVLALKSWATYVSTEKSNWIRGGGDFVFDSVSDCVGLFNTLMLIESEKGEDAPRMNFWKEVMNPIEFPKSNAPTVAV